MLLLQQAPPLLEHQQKFGSYLPAPRGGAGKNQLAILCS
jgi:hypothetical protein